MRVFKLHHWKKIFNWRSDYMEPGNKTRGSTVPTCQTNSFKSSCLTDSGRSCKHTLSPEKLKLFPTEETGPSQFLKIRQDKPSLLRNQRQKKNSTLWSKIGSFWNLHDILIMLVVTHQTFFLCKNKKVDKISVLSSYIAHVKRAAPQLRHTRCIMWWKHQQCSLHIKYSDFGITGQKRQ